MEISKEPTLQQRAIDAWEHHHLQVPLQATHHSDLEIYHHSFTIAKATSRNYLSDSTVGVSATHGLQQFQK